MECDKIKDWLMTDYLDGELGPAEKTNVESHLKGCARCRDLLEVVRKNTVLPFEGVNEMQPDPVVWRSLQEKILAEKKQRSRWSKQLKDFFAVFAKIPQPALRMAVVMALMLMVVVITQWPSPYSDPSLAYLEDQMTFLDELGSGNVDLFNGEFNSYDAALEVMTQ